MTSVRVSDAAENEHAKCSKLYKAFKSRITLPLFGLGLHLLSSMPLRDLLT